ncbi:MAG: hypothetical protein AAB425_06080 [Bdellovibrionota bacterium]
MKIFVCIAVLFIHIWLPKPAQAIVACKSLSSLLYTIPSTSAELDPNSDGKCKMGYVLVSRVASTNEMVSKCVPVTCGTYGGILCVGYTSVSGSYWPDYRCAPRKTLNVMLNPVQINPIRISP